MAGRGEAVMTKNQILIHLSESENTKFGKEEFARQSFPQKVFSAIWAVESEVNNGGFSQYFVNSSKETAAFVVEALRTIGAPDTAAICLSLRVKISDIVNSSEVSQRARVWSKADLGGGPPPEPPQVIAQPQTGRVARLSYAEDISQRRRVRYSLVGRVR